MRKVKIAPETNFIRNYFQERIAYICKYHTLARFLIPPLPNPQQSHPELAKNGPLFPLIFPILDPKIDRI